MSSSAGKSPPSVDFPSARRALPCLYVTGKAADMALVTYPEIVIIDGQPVETGLPLIPPVSELMPRTRRWRASKLKPCGTMAAWRRHQRRKETICAKCRAWRKRYDQTREGR